MKVQIAGADFMQIEQHKRAHIINSIGGFKSVCYNGTVDLTGPTTLAIFNSILSISTNPPLIRFIMQPNSVESHILERLPYAKI